MYNQITPYELDIICMYTPDREPTPQELIALEKEVPTLKELQTALTFIKDDTEWQPQPSVILEERINERDGYKRIIFNDGETTVDIREKEPFRKKKQQANIKLRSELKELYEDLRFARKQLRLKQPLDTRVRLRETIRCILKSISIRDKTIKAINPRPRRSDY